VKSSKDNGRVPAGPRRLEEELEAPLAAFGGELRALAEAVHPRADFVTALRQDVRAGLEVAPKVMVRRARRRIPLRWVVAAALALAVVLAITLAFVFAPRWWGARGAAQSLVERTGLELPLLPDRLPAGAEARLGMGQALSFASEPEGRLAVGSSVAVCVYSSAYVELWCAYQESAVTRLAFSPGGEWLAAGRADGRVILFDAAGRPVGNPIAFGLDAITGLAWLAARPARLAVVTQAAVTGIWDVERNDFAWAPWRAAGRAEALAAASGSDLLALATDAGVLALDGASGLLLHREITGPAQAVALAFNPGGDRLVAGLGEPDGRGSLVAWEVSDWSAVDTWKLDSAPRSVWVGERDRFAAVSQSGKVWMGTLHSPNLRILDGVGPGSPLVQAPTGQGFFAVGNSGAVVWLNAERATLRTVWKDYTGPVSAVAWREPGSIWALYGSAALRKWDAARAGLETTLPVNGQQGRFLAWSQDGRWILLGVGEEALLIDAASGQEAARLRGSAAQVVQGAFSPDGEQIVTADRTARLRIWNRADGSPVRTHEPLTIGATVTGLGWLPGGAEEGASNLVVTWLNSARYGLDLVDPLSGQGRRFSGIADSLGKVAWSQDGRWVASVAGKSVLVWDVATRRQRWTFTLDRADWSSVYLAFSPDGRYLAAGGRFITLWDLSTGETVEAFSGHSEYITALAFSPDGRALVSGSSDGTLLVWKLR